MNDLRCLLGFLLLAPSVLALSASNATAQLEAGDEVPDFEGTWLQSDFTHLHGTRGRVVVLHLCDHQNWLNQEERSDGDERWVTYKEGHRLLRELVRNYPERGLEVIEISPKLSEKQPQDTAARLEPWRISYQVAVLPKLPAGLGGNGDTYILDPAGRVSWRGTVEGLDIGRIETLLKRASVIPLLPKSFRGINKNLLYKSLRCGEALRSIDRELERAPTDADLLRAREQLERVYGHRKAHIERLLAARDFAVAIERLERLTKDFQGSSLQEAGETWRSELLARPEVDDDVKAAKILEQGLRLMGIEKYETATQKFDTLLRNYPDTKSAERARAALEEF